MRFDTGRPEAGQLSAQWQRAARLGSGRLDAVKRNAVLRGAVPLGAAPRTADRPAAGARA
jgi:hypothetical protein